MARIVHVREDKINRTLCGRCTDGLGVTITVQDLLRNTFPHLSAFVCRPCKGKAEKQVAPVKARR